MKEWFLYLIECRDGSIYTGVSVDVEARYAAHAAGRGARYTRSHPPLRLLGSVAYPDRSSAQKAEHEVKQLSPGAKRAFASGIACGERPPESLLLVAPGLSIPLDEIEDRHDEIDEAPLVGILCHHGVRSLKAALALQHLGHKNVVSIFGGIELWSLAVDASVPRYTRDRMTGRCVQIK